MNTTTRRSNGSRAPEDHQASSRQIEREIARTRHDMDETLHEIGERLHPRHLLDQVLDLFRSDEGRAKRHEYAHGAQKVGKQVVREMKKHPVPMLLCGAGLAWLAYEELARDDEDERWRELDHYGEPHAAVPAGGPYTGPAGREWRTAAWSKDFDWAGSPDQESWTARAQHTLDELKASLADSTVSVRDKLKSVAARTFALSGHKRKDLHAQWAALRENSGSFVDARTGEPYDDSYGEEFRNLLACDYCATAEWTPEQERSWSAKAGQALEEIQSTLSTAGASAGETFQAMASKIGEFVGSTCEMAADSGRRLGHQASHVWDRTRDGGARMGREIGERVKHGAVQTRDQFARAVDEYPLAVGAAFLGLGLLAGLVLPETRAEDEWLGEASDDLKQRAKETGQELLERGQQVAEATMAAATEEAERQGLTPQQLGEKAEHAMEKVEHVVERAADEARAETERQTSNV